jgi:hypothetical protein
MATVYRNSKFALLPCWWGHDVPAVFSQNGPFSFVGWFCVCVYAKAESYLFLSEANVKATHVKCVFT